MRVIKNRKLASKGILFGAFVVGPVWFLWPAIAGRVLYVAPNSTDLSAAIQYSQIYSRNSSPFDTSDFVNFPAGQLVTRWQELSQPIPRAFLWVASRLVEPRIALATFLLIGMAGTAAITYAVCRYFGANFISSIAVAMWVQFSPAMLLRVMNHQNYTHWWVTLLPSYLLLRRLQHRKVSRSSEIPVVISILFGLGFDPYYAWITLLLTVIVFFYVATEEGQSIRKRLGAWSLTATTLIISVFFVYGSVASLMLVRNPSSEVGRPLSVTSRDFVNNFSSDLTDWFRPNQLHRWLPDLSQYPADQLPEFSTWVGILGVLGLCGLLIGLRKAHSRPRRTIAIILLVVVGAAFPTSYHLMGFATPGLTEVLRFMFPGMRHFSRLANLLYVALAVGAAYFMTTTWKKCAPWRLRHLARLAIVVVTLLGLADFWPSEYRRLDPDAAKLFKFAEALHADGATSFFFFPMSGYERIIQNYLAIPMANPLFPGDPRYPELKYALSRGGESLADDLRSRGISHVITIRQDVLNQGIKPWSRSGVNYDIANSTSFERVESTSVKGSSADEILRIDAYRITPDTQFTIKEPVVGYRAYYQSASDYSGNDVGILWSYSGRLNLYFVRELIPDDAVVKLTLTSIQEQTIIFSTSLGEQQTLTLKAGEEKPIYLDPQVEKSMTISIQSVMPCSTPRASLGLPDDRTLCFGVRKDEAGNLLVQEQARRINVR